jgi:uncharacterized protein (TIGR00251 family)
VTTEPDWIHGRDDEVRLLVRVQPGAKRSAVAGGHGNRLKLVVQAPPVDGKANDAVCQLVAGLLKLPLRAVAVSAGHGSRDKTLLIQASLATVRAVFAG